MILSKLAIAQIINFLIEIVRTHLLLIIDEHSDLEIPFS